jgi:hypothetical protein
VLLNEKESPSARNEGMGWKNRLLAGLFMLPAAQLGAIQIDPEPEGIRNMAVVYEHGRGVKQDYAEAYKLYCKAALMGDEQSAYNLGWMYFNGRGLPRDMGIAMYWFRRAADGGDTFAKRMAARLGDISTVTDAACQPPPPEIREIQSPNRKIVEAWVNQIAPRYAIDPQLVMAVIQAESAFNPGALSNKNAQGLMQLIPATAERFRVKDVWNPVENIKGGTAYLHWLMRHFSGNVEWVVAAYNAGEGAVERYQGVPPYEETRNYVKRILTRYQKTAHPVPPELPEKATSLERTKLAFLSPSQPLSKD